MVEYAWMKTVTFYYVRHGRTEYNRDGIIQGQVDSALTEDTIPVLKETADALRDIPFARCFSSPFGRAVHTAEILLAGRDIPIETLEDLKEMSFGDIDGTPHRDHPRELKKGHILDSFRHVHGESRYDVKKRAKRAFRYMYKQCEDGDHVLISGHGSYYRYLVRAVCRKTRLGMKYGRKFKGVPNGSVSVIRCEDGKAKLLCWPLSAGQFTERFKGEKP